MLLSRWAKLLSITDDDANIYLSLDNRHRISRSIMKGKFNDYVLSELRERNQLALPPWWRFIEVSANDALLGQLSKNLLNEFPFISASAISSKGKLTLRVPVERSQEVVDSLYALQKYRSAARQRLFEIRIDPFDV
jgi:primosomal protein N'